MQQRDLNDSSQARRQAKQQQQVRYTTVLKNKYKYNTKQSNKHHSVKTKQ